MSDFVQTMKDWRRMCAAYSTDDDRCSNHPEGKQLRMTRAQINRANTCPNFALSDLGDVETGKPYRAREFPYRKHEKREYEQLSLDF